MTAHRKFRATFSPDVCGTCRVDAHAHLMDLHLTSEQTLLRDSAVKFIQAAGPKVARAFREQDPSFAPERLRWAGEVGWLGMLVPTSADGLGLGLTELALLLGRAG